MKIFWHLNLDCEIFRLYQLNNDDDDDLFYIDLREVAVWEGGRGGWAMNPKIIIALKKETRNKTEINIEQAYNAEKIGRLEKEDSCRTQ